MQGKHQAHFEVCNYPIMIGCFMHKREGASKASILSLKVLEHADLIILPAPILLPPMVMGHLGHTDRALRIRDRLALRGQRINPLYLRDNLLRHVVPSGSFGPLSQSQTSGWNNPREDHGKLSPLKLDHLTPLMIF